MCQPFLDLCNGRQCYLWFCSSFLVLVGVQLLRDYMQMMNPRSRLKCVKCVCHHFLFYLYIFLQVQSWSKIKKWVKMEMAKPSFIKKEALLIFLFTACAENVIFLFFRRGGGVIYRVICSEKSCLNKFFTGQQWLVVNWCIYLRCVLMGLPTFSVILDYSKSQMRPNVPKHGN